MLLALIESTVWLCNKLCMVYVGTYSEGASKQNESKLAGEDNDVGKRIH